MSNKIKAAALACAVTLASFTASHAMDVKLFGDKDLVVLNMSGKIELGDNDRIGDYVTKHEKWINNRKMVLLISSTGGNAGEAMKMAELMGDSTVIVKDVCASACFYIFASAKVKIIEDGARVGVHATASADHNETEAAAASAYIVTKMREKGVPDDICMDMLTTENSSIHWLSPDQLARMHAKVL